MVNNFGRLSPTGRRFGSKKESLSGTSITWLVDENHLKLLTDPEKIQDGFFVETNCSAVDLVKNLKWVLDECSVDYDNVLIIYVRRNDEKKSQRSTIQIAPQTQQKTAIKGDRESFFHWLRDDQHMAEGTCRSYVSAISSAERFAKERALDSVKLYTSNPEEAIATADELFAHQGFLRYNNDQHNRFRIAITRLLAYYDSYLSQEKPKSTSIVDERWLSILKDYFPDGYILDDFLSQFQACAFWQERYSETCPVEGDAIDKVMKAIGTIRDGRVFANNEKDKALISSIADNISDLHFTAVFNVLSYYLQNRFSFSRAIISPKGAKMEVRDLFRKFAKEHVLIEKGLQAQRRLKGIDQIVAKMKNRRIQEKGDTHLACQAVLRPVETPWMSVLAAN